MPAFFRYMQEAALSAWERANKPPVLLDGRLVFCL